MRSEAQPTSAEYAERVRQQLDQYRGVADIHALPGIFHYWSNKHLLPRMKAVLGADSVERFFARAFVARLAAGLPARFVSLGAGDCTVELGVVRELLALRAGEVPFVLECLELSPELAERGRAAARGAGLSAFVDVQVADLNAWSPAHRYAAAMANHSLHHVVELERLFAAVKGSLLPGGTFAVNDMIGRNGHQRWPEVLALVEWLWESLPPEKKYNHQLRRLEERFVNFDCSREGFEGIRSQDILPLLAREFRFTRFLAFGGLTDVFVDRGFGHNFDPGSAEDRAFIDAVEELGGRLLDAGRIKPTQMLAELAVGEPAPTCWRGWTPGFCVRDPLATPAAPVPGTP